MSRGTTLVEVLVALVVLQLGIIGPLTLLSIATRTMVRAEAVERLAATVGVVADSLSTVEPRAGAGRRETSAGVVSWTVTPDGTFAVSGVRGDHVLVRATGVGLVRAGP